jgi:hypothetical protein
MWAISFLALFLAVQREREREMQCLRPLRLLQLRRRGPVREQRRERSTGSPWTLPKVTCCWYSISPGCCHGLKRKKKREVSLKSWVEPYKTDPNKAAKLDSQKFVRNNRINWNEATYSEESLSEKESNGPSCPHPSRRRHRGWIRQSTATKWTINTACRQWILVTSNKGDKVILKCVRHEKTFEDRW